jgi:hypothetical protein
MLANESDDRFFVDVSTLPGAGLGLFARTPLSPGDRFEVIGVLILSGSISDSCTSFADQYKFRVGDLLLIPLGFGGLVNHSRRPNLEKVIVGQSVYLRATRFISANEELFLDYGGHFFDVTGLNPATFESGS